MTMGGSVAPPAPTGDSNLRANAQVPKNEERRVGRGTERPPADVVRVRGRTFESSISYPARRVVAAAVALPFHSLAVRVGRQPP
jgi:hypothetical protein